MFAREILQSNSPYDMLDSLTNRHSELQQLSKSIAEVSALMATLETMVSSQNDVIEDIYHHAEETRVDVEKGRMEMDEAVRKARSWRRKRWCVCIFLTTLIIVSLLAVFFIYVLPMLQGKPSEVGPINNNNNGTNATVPAPLPPPVNTTTIVLPPNNNRPNNTRTSIPGRVLQWLGL